MLAPFTDGEELRNPGSPNLFHIRASYQDETARMVAQLHTLGLRKFAVFYQNDGMGKSGLAGAENELAKLNLKLVAAGAYDRLKPEDIDGAVNDILKAKPDAVIMASTTKATGNFVKKMHAAESRAKLFAISTVNTKEMLKITTPEVARGLGISQVMPFPYNMASPLPVVREFHAESCPRTLEMQSKLLSAEGEAAYRQRKWIVEPPNGWIKSVLGFRQFRRRAPAPQFIGLTNPRRSALTPHIACNPPGAQAMPWQLLLPRRLLGPRMAQASHAKTFASAHSAGQDGPVGQPRGASRPVAPHAHPREAQGKHRSKVKDESLDMAAHPMRSRHTLHAATPLSKRPSVADHARHFTDEEVEELLVGGDPFFGIEGLETTRHLGSPLG